MEHTKETQKEDDANTCKFLYDGICCNDSSRYIADYPTKEDCKKCFMFEKKRKAH